MALSRFERREFHHGLECVSVISEGGFRCGYVCLPKSHPWYGLEPADYPNGQRAALRVYGNMILPDRDWDRDSIDMVIRGSHGELTHGGELGTPGLLGDWFLGFDCAHHMDGKDPELMSPSYLEIAEKWGDLFDGYPVRSQRYVLDCAAEVAREVQELSRGLQNRLRWALRALRRPRSAFMRPKIVLWGGRPLTVPYGRRYDYPGGPVM